VLAFLSAVCYAATYFLVRPGVRADDPDGGEFVTTVANAVSIGLIAAVALALTGPPAWNAPGVAWFAASGFLGTFVGRWLLFEGVHRIGPVRAAAIASAAPIVTVASAMLVIGESASFAEAAASALVSLGILMLISDEHVGHRHSAIPDSRHRGDESAEGMIGAGIIGRPPYAERPHGSVVVAASMAGTTAAIGSAVAYGFARSARKVAMDAMPAPVFGAAIAVWAALVVTVVRQARRGRLGRSLRLLFVDVRPHQLASGFLSTLAQLAFFLALSYAPLADVALISASENAIVLVLGIALFRHSERISWRIVVPAVCISVGAALVALS